jgi:hypothetical protein
MDRIETLVNNAKTLYIKNQEELEKKRLINKLSPERRTISQKSAQAKEKRALELQIVPSIENRINENDMIKITSLNTEGKKSSSNRSIIYNLDNVTVED